MKKLARFGAAGVVGLALGAGAILWFAVGNRDPLSADREAVALPVRDLRGNDPAARLRAAIALGDLGPQARAAVPELIAALRRDDEELRINVVVALGNIGADSVPELAKALDDPDPLVRFYAVWALGMVGAPARSTAPAVIRVLTDTDPDVRRKAAYALGRIDPPVQTAAPALIAAFNDNDLDVREAATAAIARLGPEAVPLLVESLKDRYPVRGQALAALRELGPSAEAAVPALCGLLGDADGSAAFSTLAAIGPAAIPALVNVRKNGLGATCQQALDALGQMAGTKAVEALLDALKDPNPSIRLHCARLLNSRHVDDPSVVLALVEMLSTDYSTTQRLQAVIALENSPSDLRPALPVLLDIIKQGARDHAYPGEGANLYRHALRALGRCGPDALPHLVAMQQPRSESGEVVQALCQVAFDPRMPLATLLTLLRNPNQSVQVCAVDALNQFGTEARPHQVALLTDKDPVLRRQAVIGLLQIPGDHAALLAILAPLVKDPDGNVRIALLANLGRFGLPAVPYLAGALRDSNPSVRWMSLQSLSQMGASAKEAVTALIEVLKDESQGEGIRSLAASVLGRIGPDAKSAIPALIVATRDPDPGVSQSARSALLQIRSTRVE